ncbi:TPA: LPXTG cell wall anchor domain-containing protein, partial [Streptococcus suis]|nr:LPXTG cell wall anchor domain-containing protein [Streptococcus suis]
EPITGKVVAGETKEITYVYQKAGNVNVNYVDTEGNVLKDKVADVVNGKPDSDYDTVLDNKLAEILYNGNLYKLVPAGTYNVGTVAKDNNLTTVGNGKATGIDPVTGKVVAGETKEITYVYQLVTGNVVITYVDTEGNPLKSEVKDTTNEPVGESYNTKEDENEYPSTIEKDGDKYYRVEAGNHTVGNTTEDGHLVSSDDPKGTVEEGTKTVTYVYQKAGNVNVNYVDTEGNVLKDKVADVVNGKPDSDYDTVLDNKLAEILYNGNLYKLVPAGSYKVGVVGANNNLTEVGNGKATGIDPVTGKVVAGETKEITYVYQLVTGNVVITYVDTEGNPLKSEVKDTTNEPVGESYNTKEDENEYPSTIEKDGDKYYRVEKGEYKVGETTEDGHLVSSDKPAGTVEEGTKTVTYVYEKVTGSVVARYVIEGTETEIADDKTVKPKETPVDEVYGDTSPLIIEKNGKKYILVRTRTNEGDAPENGVVVEGEQVITYEYKELEENPTPVPPTPRPNPGRPGTPVTPAKPATPTADKAKQLPNTGEASSSAGVLGVAMLVAAIVLAGKRRRNED